MLPAIATPAYVPLTKYLMDTAEGRGIRYGQEGKAEGVVSK
jgi:hypothetical protein